MIGFQDKSQGAIITDENEKLRRLLEACGVFDEISHKLQRLLDRVIKAVEEANDAETGDITPVNLELLESFFEAANEVQNLYLLKTLNQKKEIEEKILEEFKKYFTGSKSDSVDKWIAFFESEAGKEFTEIRTLMFGITDDLMEKIGEAIIEECFEEIQAKEKTAFLADYKDLLKGFKSSN